MALQIALSPCPNDTFIFHAWIKEQIKTPLSVDPHFADIQQLNEWALEKRFPLIKVSFNCFREIVQDYELLPVGAALGLNCGPKIVALRHFELKDLGAKRVAIPGKMTTAHLLLEKLVGEVGEKYFCLYNEISTLLKMKKVDCGVIIHESRFTFLKEGFVEIVDLGDLWEKRYALPLPLGGIAIRRDLERRVKQKILAALSASLAFAKKNPGASKSFVLQYSQEKDPLVVEAHIATYVNRETEWLSSVGMEAIKVLLGCHDTKKISPDFCDKRRSEGNRFAV